VAEAVGPDPTSHDVAPGALPARLAAWRDTARASYIAGYEEAAGAPVDAALLALFELHKSV
jgi:predicted trehalose synthase